MRQLLPDPREVARQLRAHHPAFEAIEVVEGFARDGGDVLVRVGSARSTAEVTISRAEATGHHLGELLISRLWDAALRFVWGSESACDLRNAAPELPNHRWPWWVAFDLNDGPRRNYQPFGPRPSLETIDESSEFTPADVAWVLRGGR